MDEECCLGVKLAYTLDVHGDRWKEWESRLEEYEQTQDLSLDVDGEDHPYWFEKGKDLACKRLGINEWQLKGLLWMCGADDEPFGEYAWPADIDDVWNRLMCIEELPAWLETVKAGYVWGYPASSLEGALTNLGGDRKAAWDGVKLHKHADPFIDDLTIDEPYAAKAACR